MSNNIEAFVSTYQQCFPGTSTPPMPKKVNELPMTTQLAIRDANPGLWQAMFAGHGERLPADVEARLTSGNLLPGDGPALRNANWDALALQCDQSREATFARVREAERAKEKAQHEAEAARFRQFNESSFLERLAASPLSDQAIAQAREQWGITGN